MTTAPNGYFVPEGQVYRRILRTTSGNVTVELHTDGEIVPGVPAKWRAEVTVTTEPIFHTPEEAAAWVESVTPPALRAKW